MYDLGPELLFTYIILGHIVLSAGVSLAAEHRGRRPLAWFLLSLFLSPVVALLALLLMPVRSRSMPDLLAGFAQPSREIHASEPIGLEPSQPSLVVSRASDREHRPPNPGQHS